MKWHGWSVRVREAEIIPTGYGAAWQDWQTRTWVCLPLPFNVIAGRLRALYFWFVSGAWNSVLDKRINAAVIAERAIWRERDHHADERQRRKDFRAGYDYAFDTFEADIKKQPRPDMPEWAK